MSTPSHPDWLAELISNEGESKPIDVHERDALTKVLRAAFSPDNIDERHHRQILAQALSLSSKPIPSPPDDPLAPPRVEELVAATRLRNHLDSDPLVVSLRSAHHPSAPQPNAEMVARDLALTRKAKSVASRTRRLVPSAWGVLAVAAAAALWFVVRSNGILLGPESVRQGPRVLAQSHSTESLFAKPFALSSHSERIDRIAQARSRDLRENRYTIWGLP
jgi:hypothetical protein